jgi:hypothetical protein
MSLKNPRESPPNPRRIQSLENHALSEGNDDFPIEQILARWKEAPLETMLADASMLHPAELAELAEEMLARLRPERITFEQFAEQMEKVCVHRPASGAFKVFLCVCSVVKTMSSSQRPFNLILTMHKSSSDNTPSGLQELSHKPQICPESANLASRLGRGSRPIEHVSQSTLCTSTTYIHCHRFLPMQASDTRSVRARARNNMI